MDTHHHAHEPSGQPAEAHAVDPVCGMNVHPAQAAGTFQYQGHQYFFCSPKCLARFRAAPESFVSAQPAVAPEPVHTDAIYTCPMHPEVRQAGPGSCPKCGMALEPVDLAAV